MTVSRLTAGMAAFYALVSLSPLALADGPEAVATAAQHAGLAAAAGELAGVRRHLHHTLNCLVGPDGEGFDASAGNPCNSAGGAIPQTADAAARGRLEQAAATVRSALGNDNVAAAKETAMSVQSSLE